MNKYCKNCNMNFSDTFEECPYCEGELIIQDLSQSEPCDMTEYYKEHPEEMDILEMPDDVLLDKYKDYLNSIREQGCQMTDEEFIKGLREGRKDSMRRSYHSTPASSTPITTTPIITCPYCQSTNTKKITATAKAVNVALFGIFGNKRKYQWHCNNCNSDF